MTEIAPSPLQGPPGLADPHEGEASKDDKQAKTPKNVKDVQQSLAHMFPTQAGGWPEYVPQEPWMTNQWMADPSTADPTALYQEYLQVRAVASDYHARCMQMAHSIFYLKEELVRISLKVTELEAWKKNTLEQVRQLRADQNLLRRKIDGGSEETVGQPSVLKRAISQPTPQKTLEPPPGLSTALAQQPVKVVQSSDLQGSTAIAATGIKPPGPVLPSVNADEDDEEEGPEMRILERATTAPPIITSSGPFIKRVTSSDEVAGEGIRVIEGSVVVSAERGEVNCLQAKWTIGHFSSKLKGCNGRALVSSPFNAAGLEEVRLMVSPDAEDKTKGPRSRRQKEIYAKRVSEGPLHGILKLKVPTCPAPSVFEFYLSVGSHRVGPFKHDFQNSTVHAWGDFGINWLDQVDPTDQSLTVGVEILQADVMAVPHPPSNEAMEAAPGAMSVQALAQKVQMGEPKDVP
eukprot:gnl/TRDRNA2_/TRDRNA2_183340_c0_seq1.p1 gnl/TRDRNA2_/TRDRNA2_183340_c0~~gnl/TRDRNA2_/TRDRNA2_183340_c0_seq1.p1  ORF type:complete len:491 (+),score=83.97 gnl/TRDRNA2_/TRDRNA2_183340_c0_seq1:91-1473(+)